MTPLRPPTRQNRLLILWILWGSIIMGLVIIHTRLHAPYDRIVRGRGALLWVPFTPLAISIAIRLLIIPKMKTFTKLLPVFVMGLATAEACGLLGTFLFDGWDSLLFFAISLVVLLCHAPFYAQKLKLETSEAAKGV